MTDMHPDRYPVSSSAPDHPIRYPTNTVIGVVDTHDQLDGLVGALVDGGFMQSEIEVATGAATADAVHATTGRPRPLPNRRAGLRRAA